MITILMYLGIGLGIGTKLGGADFSWLWVILPLAIIASLMAAGYSEEKREHPKHTLKYVLVRIAQNLGLVTGTGVLAAMRIKGVDFPWPLTLAPTTIFLIYYIIKAGKECNSKK